MTSSEATATALASGFPPKVLKRINSPHLPRLYSKNQDQNKKTSKNVGNHSYCHINATGARRIWQPQLHQ